MFGAAGCFACHRFGNEGGMTGPDLTHSGRAIQCRHDLLDNIINPSKEINEQFAADRHNHERRQNAIEGVIVNLNGDVDAAEHRPVRPVTSRLASTARNVKSIETSKVSPMPEGPAQPDSPRAKCSICVAYVLSGGDKSNDMFKK